MLDIKLLGGEIVDGSGAARFRGDIGIAGGRIAAVGVVEEPAAQVVDASGLIVAPGFIDTHTHHDAGVFWDPAATPSPLHGVTTVIGGNCGFSIAPLDANADDVDYVMRMLARVEGMPLEALQAGLDWDWTSFGDWLGRLDGHLAVNAGFLAGHSTIRRMVMGDAAVGEEATPAQIEAMVALLRESLAGGALGVSSSTAQSHNDGEGQPVPSRFAAADEHIALAAALRDYPGTSLAFNPGASPFDDAKRLMRDMSVAAQRVLNWNALLVDRERVAAVEHELSVSDYAAEGGGAVLAQVILDPRRFYMSFINGFILDALPDWPWLFALPRRERLRAMGETEVRDRLRRAATGPGVPAVLQRYTDWGRLILVETFAPEQRSFAGRTVGDVAASLGKDPLDTLFDIVGADELRTVFMPTPTGDDEESWRIRAGVLRDPRTVIGASDSGAHLDVASSFNYSTSLLGATVRQRNLLTLEEAVYELTGAQRRVCGVKHRGRVAEGWAADLVVFDATTIAPRPVQTRDDLPGGANRLFAGADGIEHVFVNGVEVVREGALTGALSGTALRSGRDTETVPLS
jgi:N-acyl-D-aspartate/D-glutamate deacylase